MTDPASTLSRAATSPKEAPAADAVTKLAVVRSPTSRASEATKSAAVSTSQAKTLAAGRARTAHAMPVDRPPPPWQ